MEAAVGSQTKPWEENRVEGPGGGGTMVQALLSGSTLKGSKTF